MEFLGPSRSRRCVQARNISIFLYKKLSGDTMSNTGKLFERDHTTIIHSIEKIKDQLKEDEELHDRINGLSQMIQK
jgi:chromosomal replication initiator protein